MDPSLQVKEERTSFEIAVSLRQYSFSAFAPPKLAFVTRSPSGAPSASTCTPPVAPLLALAAPVSSSSAVSVALAAPTTTFTISEVATAAARIASATAFAITHTATSVASIIKGGSVSQS